MRLRRRWTAAQRAGGVVLAAAGSCLLLFILVYSDVAFQGRELYPALSGVCVLLGLGLVGLVAGAPAIGVAAAPNSARQARSGVGLLVGVVGSLGAINLYSIVGFVLPLLNKP